MESNEALVEAVAAPGVKEVLEALSTVSGCAVHVRGADGNLLSPGEESAVGASAGKIGRKAITVAGEEVGSVEVSGGDGGTTELAAQAAAACLENHLDAERQFESLTQEIVERYEEVNLLYDLSAELGVLFDVEEIARRSLETALQIMEVKTAAFLVCDEKTGRFTAAAVAGTAPEIDTTFAADGKTGLLGEISAQRKSIVANGEGELPKKVRAEEKRFPTSGLLAVPLLHSPDTPEEVLLGAALFHGKTAGPFRSGDEKLIGAISSQAATAIYNTRLVEELKESTRFKRDMELAEQIQSSMLPARAPSIEGAQLAGRCETAVNVGGDYYDYVVNAEGDVDILLGDVTGHSLGAALMMTAARATLRSIVSDSPGPDTVARRSNTLLYDDLDRSDLMISLFVARYVPGTRRLSYANAGHNPPFVIRRGGVAVESLGPTGIILGVLPDTEYELKEVVLEPGDVVFFYTDGVTEAMDAERNQFGEERLCSVLARNTGRSAAGVIDAVSEAVKEWIGNGKATDDITSLALKVDE